LSAETSKESSRLAKRRLKIQGVSANFGLDDDAYGRVLDRIKSPRSASQAARFNAARREACSNLNKTKEFLIQKLASSVPEALQGSDRVESKSGWRRKVVRRSETWMRRISNGSSSSGDVM
jgi:hypothetical protein